MSDTEKQSPIDMPTTYDPTSAERKWYEAWMERGYFQAGRRPDAPKYTIVIPPQRTKG